MAIIKDFGIVLREYDTGESNKKLVLLTQNSGKIVVFARGSKRADSKLAANLFCYNEFIVFDGGSFLSLNQLSLIRRFGGIAEDFESYCVACYFLEIIDSMILPNMETTAILTLALRALNELSAKRLSSQAVFATFTFKFLQLEGFAPLIDSCQYCEKQLFGNVWLMSEGLICDECGTSRGQVGVYLSEQTKSALEYILTVECENIFAYRASADVQELLYRAARWFLAANIDSDFKSLTMLN